MRAVRRLTGRGQIAKNHAKGVNFVPMLPTVNNPDDVADARTCFPTASGRWTYDAIYVAPTNHRLNASDALLPTDGYGQDWGHNQYGAGIETRYVLQHNTTHPANQWSLAACRAAYSWILTSIRQSKVTGADPATVCAPMDGNNNTYQIEYVCSTPTPLFPGDQVATADIGTGYDGWHYDWSVTHHE